MTISIKAVERPKRLRKGRKCSMKGCGTILCSYNKGTYCFSHSRVGNWTRLQREAIKLLNAKKRLKNKGTKNGK